jgi:hypothetical protein
MTDLDIEMIRSLKLKRIRVMVEDGNCAGAPAHKDAWNVLMDARNVLEDAQADDPRGASRLHPAVRDGIDIALDACEQVIEAAQSTPYAQPKPDKWYDLKMAPGWSGNQDVPAWSGGQDVDGYSGWQKIGIVALGIALSWIVVYLVWQAAIAGIS